MVSGSIPDYQSPIRAAHLPVIIHMVLVLLLGLYLPSFLSGWFHSAYEVLK